MRAAPSSQHLPELLGGDASPPPGATPDTPPPLRPRRPLLLCSYEDGLGPVDSIVVTAFGVGNLTALANDPHYNPGPLHPNYVSLGSTLNANVVVKELRVGGWPFQAMFTIAEVKPGEDLRYDYGPGYWTTWRCNAIKAAKAVRPAPPARTPALRCAVLHLGRA